MRLEEIEKIAGGSVRLGAGESASVEISDLSYDSRRITQGCLFFCVRGARRDGHDFAGAAGAAGAAAVVCDHSLPLKMPQLIVGDTRVAMNRVAAPFFGDPTREMSLVGLTGTKGKTTSAYLLYSIFGAAGLAGGLVGTIEIRYGHRSAPGVRTTPQSVDLQRIFREMADSGVRACAMEATSIGLHQGRVDGSRFEVGVFTNLSRDHLDEYHGTMEDYYQAKRLLFAAGRTEHALVNVDDHWGARLASEIEVKVSTFGLALTADYSAADIEISPRGSRFRLVGPGVDLTLEPRLPGRVNIYNALAAASAAHLLGMDDGATASGVSALDSIPGRFERIEEGQGFVVLVDYAHTPHSLAEALSAARGMASGRVIVVFGCGGDRDRAKRPLMGESAARASDLVIVTSDNPRDEDPEEIMREIESGIGALPPLGYEMITDRADAIAKAISSARDGDVVLIAGKGHETSQEFSEGRTVLFDDREVARDLLRGTT